MGKGLLLPLERTSRQRGLKAPNRARVVPWPCLAIFALLLFRDSEISENCLFFYSRFFSALYSFLWFRFVPFRHNSKRQNQSYFLFRQSNAAVSASVSTPVVTCQGRASTAAARSTSQTIVANSACFWVSLLLHVHISFTPSIVYFGSTNLTECTPIFICQIERV